MIVFQDASKAHPAAAPVLSSELGAADLGDDRLNRRLGLLVDSLADRPAGSFPKALDDAELEAAYRFFGNASVTPEGILAPHFRQTARRAAEHRNVLVIHDTTQFEFGGASKREGLGRLIRPGQAFFGHFALATSADGDREPLGLLGLETLFRLDKVSPKPRPQRPNRGESARWRRSIDAAEAQLDSKVRAIHVMDREADSYSILSCLDDAKRAFVIRSFQDRVLANEETRSSGFKSRTPRSQASEVARAFRAGTGHGHRKRADSSD